MSTPIENNMVINNGSDPANPRLRLGVSANPFSSTARGTPETSRRNFRLRINGSRQQDHISSNPFSPEAGVANADVSSSQHSSNLLLRNHFFDLNPPPAVENGSIHGQSVLLRRNPQSRWSGASSSRTNTSAISGERDPMLYEESMSRNIPRSISEHPMFLPTGEIGSSSQQPTNWNMGGNNIAGNVASTSRAGSGSGINSSAAPTWSNRSRPQYSRRLSEIVRRSLLSSAGVESGGQSSNQVVYRVHHRVWDFRLDLVIMAAMYLTQDRHCPRGNTLMVLLDYLIHCEVWLLLVKEEAIRHVLDLMRRGEGLRFEELLALEERIGNVCTGLNEETIMSRLKQQKYIKRGAENHADTEPCSICRV
ncbi:hypothetical protein DH2020_008244 [Rehmannia glutinosa]|uniref:RING-type E3 ubiquitin transferase n=1 Tax=Rehmannia glutinosa TaxID=99300 RepID=A0ABR0U1H3_REHGL